MGQILELWFSAGKIVNVPLMGKISTLPLIMAILFSFARASAGVFVVDEIKNQRRLAVVGLVSLLSLIVVFETLGAGYRGWILAEEQERIISAVISGTLGFVIPIMEIITGQFSLREFFLQAAPVGWSKFKALIIWLAFSIVRTLFAFHRDDEINNPFFDPVLRRVHKLNEKLGYLNVKIDQLGNDVDSLNNDMNSLSDFDNKCEALYNNVNANVTQFIRLTSNTANLQDNIRQFKENYRNLKRDCKNFLHHVKGIAREYIKKLKFLRKKGRGLKWKIQSFTKKRTKLDLENGRIIPIINAIPDPNIQALNKKEITNQRVILTDQETTLTNLRISLDNALTSLDAIHRNRTIQSTRDAYLSKGRALLTQLDGHRKSILQKIRQNRLQQFLSFWERAKGPLGIISFFMGCGLTVIWLIFHFLLSEIISPWWLIIGIGLLILGLVFLSLTPQEQKN